MHITVQPRSATMLRACLVLLVLMVVVSSAIACRHRRAYESVVSALATATAPRKWMTTTTTEPSPVASTVVPSSQLNRGKWLPDNMNALDTYLAYKEVERDYLEKAFNSTDWQVVRNRDDIEVSILEHPSDPNCPYVRLRTIIPVPAKTCWDFLKIEDWDKNMPKMDPFYEGVSTHGHFVHKDVQMTLCRKRTKRILAYKKRDLVFLCVADRPLPDGTLVSGSVSVQTNMLPRHPDYTRAFQNSISFYKPINNGRETELSMICRIDLNDSAPDNGSGGSIPMWLYLTTIGHTAADTMSRMKKVLMAEHPPQPAKTQHVLFDPRAAMEKNKDVLFDPRAAMESFRKTD